MGHHRGWFRGMGIGGQPLSAPQQLPDGLRGRSSNTKNPWSRTRLGARKCARERIARVEDLRGARQSAARLRGCEALQTLTIEWDGRRRPLFDAAAKSATPIYRKITCKHRFCESCAARKAEAMRRELEPRISARWPKSNPKLLTLSQRGRAGETAEHAFQRFEDRLAALMKSPLWRNHVRGGLVGIEATWSTPESRDRANERAIEREEQMSKPYNVGARRRGEWWHVHAHLILDLKPCSRKTCAVCLERDPTDRQRSIYAQDERGRRVKARVQELRDEARIASEILAFAKAAGAPKKQIRALKDDADKAAAALAPLSRDKSLRGRALAQDEILRTWRACIGQPYGKDGGARIERVKSPREGGRGIGEAIKYPIKMMDIRAIDDDRLGELLAATEKRKLLRTFGNLRRELSERERNGEKEPTAKAKREMTEEAKAEAIEWAKAQKKKREAEEARPDQIPRVGKDGPVLPFVVVRDVNWKTGISQVIEMTEGERARWEALPEELCGRPLWVTNKDIEREVREALYQAHEEKTAASIAAREARSRSREENAPPRRHF